MQLSLCKRGQPKRKRKLHWKITAWALFVSSAMHVRVSLFSVQLDPNMLICCRSPFTSWMMSSGLWNAFLLTTTKKSYSCFIHSYHVFWFSHHTLYTLAICEILKPVDLETTSKPQSMSVRSHFLLIRTHDINMTCICTICIALLLHDWLTV